VNRTVREGMLNSYVGGVILVGALNTGGAHKVWKHRGGNILQVWVEQTLVSVKKTGPRKGDVEGLDKVSCASRELRTFID